MNTRLTRRNFLKSASIALALIPLVVISRQARAQSNTAVRAQLKYQNSPKDNMSCYTCLEFIAGKTSQDPGKCKVIPDDDEISPNGYCTKWNTM
ncbi:high-potential iron-sulfur protein [mine drainage metagenome]|uniref:High-potential iron-sulfur protein n=1 Tax=mine drainage metagenome TaxID=410659 RepID=A0A1J5TZ92_9ZZZZ